MPCSQRAPLTNAMALCTVGEARPSTPAPCGCILKHPDTPDMLPVTLTCCANHPSPRASCKLLVHMCPALVQPNPVVKRTPRKPQTLTQVHLSCPWEAKPRMGLGLYAVIRGWSQKDLRNGYKESKGGPSFRPQRSNRQTHLHARCMSWRMSTRVRQRQ